MAGQNDISASTAVVLFQKQLPNLPRVLFPLKFLWYWFTRKYNVFVRQWPMGKSIESNNEPMAILRMDDIIYGEAPRFRLQEQALYFVDMYGKHVLKYDLQTQRGEIVVECEQDYVSGLGWLPDGRQLVVSVNDRKLLIHNDKSSKKLEEYADLSHVTRFRANDMVVHSSGRAYVGNFGFDYDNFLDCHSTTLVSVGVDRSVRVEATGLLFPNGSVITPDGKTLIVGETFAGCLTAFDIDPEDGSLSNRRIWADIGVPADGICLDAEGCVWVASPQIGAYETAGALLRVREGGEILDLFGYHRNGITNGVFACQLATDGEGKHHLFFLEAATSKDRILTKQDATKVKKNGVLKSIEVNVGPALMPSNPNYSGGYC